MKIHALPAAKGDCLLVEYGSPTRRILIDGGMSSSYSHLREKLQSLRDQGHSEYELLVITHIDQDHILGILDLLEDDELADLVFKRIWFNGWMHLVPEHGADLGPVEGERLSEILARKHATAWNAPFAQTDLHNGAIVTHADDSPKVVEDIDGITITILSPTPECLVKLAPEWEKTVKANGLVPGVELAILSGQDEGASLGDEDLDELASRSGGTDSSKANGSSIALLLEADGHRFLLTGDAFKGVLLESIRKVVGPRKKLALDLCKLSHHGSKNNTSKSLLKSLDCRHWLVSTNGDDYGHPDACTLAWVVMHARPSSGEDPVLHFNYKTEFNRAWGNATWKAEHHYQARFARNKSSGIEVDPDDY
jgi:hypothetical protein